MPAKKQNWLNTLFVCAVFLTVAAVLFAANLPEVFGTAFKPMPVPVLGQSDVIQIFLFLTLIFISITLFACAILSVKVYLGYPKETLCCLGTAALAMAAWLYSESKLPAFTGLSTPATLLMSFFAFQLMWIALFLYYISVVPGRHRAIKTFTAVLILFFYVNFFWFFASGYHYPPLLVPYHIVLAVTYLYSIVEGIRTANRLHNTALWVNVAAMSLMYALFLTDLVHFYTDPQHGFTVATTGGLLIFILFFAFISLKNIGVYLMKAKNFETAAAFVPNGICRAKLTEELPITYANTAYYELYGFKNEEAYGDKHKLSVLTFLAEPEKKRFAQVLQHNQDCGRYEFDIETEQTDRNGKTKYFLSKIKLRPETQELFAAVSDVTERKTVEQRLHMSEEEYRLAVSHSGSRICRYELKNKRLYQEESDAQKTGMPVVIENAPETLLGKNMIAEESREDLLDFFKKMYAGEPQGHCVVKGLKIETNDWRWYKADYSLVYDQDSVHRRSIITFNDITQQREQELAYERMRREIEDIPEHMMASYECNLTKNTVEIKRGTLLNGIKETKNKGFNERTAIFLNAVIPADRERYAALMSRENLIASYYDGNTALKQTVRLQRSGREYKWIYVTVQLIRYYDTNDIQAFIVFYDVDKHRREALSLEERTRTDSLTGILNRQTFLEDITSLLHSPSDSPLVLLMLDLDAFKDVNDRLGHTKGDWVLKETAARLTKQLQENEFCGRFGGDEFVICIPGTITDETLLARMRCLAETLQMCPENQVRVSASIGAAISPRDGTNFEQLFEKADTAMYAAKKAGGNRGLIYRVNMKG